MLPRINTHSGSRLLVWVADRRRRGQPVSSLWFRRLLCHSVMIIGRTTQTRDASLQS